MIAIASDLARRAIWRAAVVLSERDRLGYSLSLYEL
jgi:hypothetical protein